MSHQDDVPPPRVTWTWRSVAGLVLVVVYLLLLNLVYRSGREVLALALLAAGLVAPGVWQWRRSRAGD